MDEDLVEHSIIDIQGADCPSCVYTIEHVGRKIRGVSDVTVDVNTHEIHVEFDGNPAVLMRIVDIVRTIGYEARLRAEHPNDTPEASREEGEAVTVTL
jgi:cation transport ATPase